MHTEIPMPHWYRAPRFPILLARLRERIQRVGGEMGNSRSMLHAQRAIPAYKPECALQRRRTVRALIVRGVCTAMTVCSHLTGLHPAE